MKLPEVQIGKQAWQESLVDCRGNMVLKPGLGRQLITLHTSID